MYKILLVSSSEVLLRPFLLFVKSSEWRLRGRIYSMIYLLWVKRTHMCHANFLRRYRQLLFLHLEYVLQ